MKKFNNLEEYKDILLEFEKTCNEIRKKETSEVSFETKTFYDDKSETCGVVHVAFLRKPNIIASIKAFDLIAASKIFEAGFYLFDAVFIKEHSDSVFENQDSLKIGLCSKISALLDLEAVDIKKK